MRQKEARDAILRIWDNMTTPEDKADATVFCFYLKAKHPNLLSFKTPGSDVCEAVKSWLMSTGRLNS